MFSKDAPSPQTEAIHVLMRVMRRHRACVERQIADLDIHPSQHHMLMRLARCEHIPSQRELAALMGISPAAVATTLKKLEREGYITRVSTDSDLRRNEIRITECGLAKVRESHAIFEAVDRAMFEGLDEESLRTLSSLVARLDDNLDRMGAPDACPAHKTEGS